MKFSIENIMIFFYIFKILSFIIIIFYFSYSCLPNTNCPSPWDSAKIWPKIFTLLIGHNNVRDDVHMQMIDGRLMP